MNFSSVVAAFDFDHTLTYRDSFLPFLFFMNGKWKTRYQLAMLSKDFIKFGFGHLSRQGMKEKIIHHFLRGKSFADIEALGLNYADKILDQYLNPIALEKLKWHQSQNHRCILVSASLDFYLKPWAERHGFEAVLSSQLELTSEQKISGRLIDQNCWGEEKVNRLNQYLGPKDGYQLYAYGDSRGDQEMLKLADYAFYRKFH